MVYAGDQWVLLPVRDLYDTLMMAMAINAARDMYEKGEKRLDDFYTKYGDFTSPILKDMDAYNNIIGGVRDKINQLYAAGIDPLRSAEGRAAVAQLTRSIPIGDIAKLRQSAETAKEYIKSFGDDTNPELEKFLGRDLSLWSTLGDGTPGSANGIWGTSKASKYQDLNQYTSHIFDNVKDSYIGTDLNHYDWFGVTEQDLANSLTPDKLGGLLNTALGRFHYQNAIKDLAAQGNLNPTDAEKMQQFRNNIIAANHERVHRDRKINEMWKLQEEGRQRMRAAHASRPPVVEQPNQWSFAELVRRSGSTAVVGKQVQEYSDAVLQAQRDEQIKFGNSVSKTTGNHSATSKGVSMYKNKYGQNVYRKSDIINYLSSMGYQTTEDGRSIIIPKNELGKLNTLETLVTNTTGFRNKKVSTSRKSLKNADFVIYTPTGGSYLAFMKNSRNEAHFEGQITLVNYKRDESGNISTDEKGKKLMDTDNINTKTLYLDSDIKSVQNDPRMGSLNGPKKQKIVNTLDSRYQNAINADKEATDVIIKGTDYNADAILSEEPGWGGIIIK